MDALLWQINNSVLPINMIINIYCKQGIYAKIDFKKWDLVQKNPFTRELFQNTIFFY